jgi:diadenylate cyclase
MSVITVIDILLVAIIIYELLALIKGTRAAYMLVGVAVLALALYFSSVGELVTLNWL